MKIEELAREYVDALAESEAAGLAFKSASSRLNAARDRLARTEEALRGAAMEIVTAKVNQAKAEAVSA